MEQLYQSGEDHSGELQSVQIAPLYWNAIAKTSRGRITNSSSEIVPAIALLSEVSGSTRLLLSISGSLPENATRGQPQFGDETSALKISVKNYMSYKIERCCLR